MRTSGLLLSVSSLPSPYGIGAFGAAAYRFVDFLVEARQSHWQILPLGCTGYADSPYQSFSTFAGNPYFIDLDLLCDEGLLTPNECSGVDWGGDARRVDYGALHEHRFNVLYLAYGRFDKTSDAFKDFCDKQAYWLDDFALFMALKHAQGGVSWQQWPQPYRLRQPKEMAGFAARHTDEIGFWRFTQFQFFKQWHRLKAYANRRGVTLIGDLPIYVADDSADVWANPALFALDDDRRPLLVAGVPPDAFSADGQLWGNPVYNWDEMARRGYDWWIARMRMACDTCDIVRLDHFRGVEQYYVLPAGAANAVGGSWRQGPGMALFEALQAALGPLPLIAENLGYLTHGTRQLHDDSGYPGMRVLQFGFSAGDHDNENLPHNVGVNNVVYAGTHDNDTTAGWLAALPPADRAHLLDYLGIRDGAGLVWQLLRAVLATHARCAVLTMQDCLQLGPEARMNTPSTLDGNWQWRALDSDFDPTLAKRLAQMTQLYGRAAPSS